MPIGLPKVLFKSNENPDGENKKQEQAEAEVEGAEEGAIPEEEEEEEEEEWIDIYDWLYDQRVLFLTDIIEEEVSSQLIAVMIYLSRQEPDKELFLYIDSPGGGVLAGMSLYDTIKDIAAPVNTICVGTAVSTASFILAGGAFGKRSALPHSRIMIRQPEGWTEGQVSEMASESEELIRIRRQVGIFYADCTGQSLIKIARDMDRNEFMSAREAKEYGLVDQVILHEQEW